MRARWLFGVAVLLHLGATAAASAAPRTAEEVIAAVRIATAPYVDIAKAREDGFVQVSGMEPRHGVHFMNPRAQISAAATMLAGELDLARPPMLIYVEHRGAWQLAGVEYALPARPAVDPLPGAEWHRHEASCHYRDWQELPARRAAECPARHPSSGAGFTLWHPTFVVAHVWAWYPNPAGPFAHDNAWLGAWGGTPSAAHGHRLLRNETEIAYSEFNHRLAGAVLLALGALAIWTIARPRHVVPRVMAAAGWVALGVYIFVMADPEAWPIGPGRFVQIFDDMQLLQHKMFSLIPMAIGVMELARACGVGARTAWALPALVLAGSLALFYHDHEGEFHLDRIFFQHATMGAVGLMAGLTLLVARRRQTWVRRATWAWPVVLLVTALVLLLYTE